MTLKQQVSLHGRRVGVTPDDVLYSKNAIGTGGEDKASIVLPGSFDTVAVFDDFLGDLVGDEWAVVTADTGGDNTGVIVTGTNGILRLTTENSPVNTVAGAISVSTGAFKQWKANQGAGSPNTEGHLRFAARLKWDSVSRTAQRQHVFAGFCDSGGSEFPVYDTGAGIISAAADYCGFMFSPGGDTGWSLVAGKSTAGDSGDQVVATTASPAANTYEEIEIDIHHGISDTGGTATFYRNGVAVGSITSPVNSATALAPKIGFFPQDTGARNLDIDLVNISAPRDTGV